MHLINERHRKQANYIFSLGSVTVRGRERMLNAEEMCRGKVRFSRKKKKWQQQQQQVGGD